MARFRRVTPRRGLTGVGILAVLLGIGLAIHYYLSIQEQETFKTRGVWVNASIIDFYVSKGQRTKEGTGDSTYYFTYTWADGQGVAHKARNSVSLETYFAHKSRASNYEIAYLPEDPERHMSRADVESRNPERSLIVAAVIALVGFYLLAAMGFVGLAGRRDQGPMPLAKRAVLALGLVALPIGLAGGGLSYLHARDRGALEARGLWVEAKVYGARKQFDEDWIYTIRFEYTDSAGRTHKGSASVDQETYEHAAKDGSSTHPVVYLPDRPRLHMTRAELTDRSHLFVLIAGAVLALVGQGLLLSTLFFAPRGRATLDRPRPRVS